MAAACTPHHHVRVLCQPDALSKRVHERGMQCLCKCAGGAAEHVHGICCVVCTVDCCFAATFVSVLLCCYLRLLCRHAGV